MNIIDRMLGNEFNIVDTMVESADAINVIECYYNRTKSEELRDMKKRNIAVIIGSILALGIAGGTIGYKVGGSQSTTAKSDIKAVTKYQEPIKVPTLEEFKQQQESIKPHKAEEHKEEHQQESIKPHKAEEHKEDQEQEGTVKHKLQKEYDDYLKYVKSTGGRAFPSYEEFLVIYDSYKKESAQQQEQQQESFKEDYNLIEEKIYQVIEYSFNTCAVDGISEYLDNNDIVFKVNSVPNGNINIIDIKGFKYLNSEYINIALSKELKDITNKEHSFKITISKADGLSILFLN